MMSVYSSKLPAPSSDNVRRAPGSTDPNHVTQDKLLTTNSTLTKRRRHVRVGWNINEHVCSADSTPRAEPYVTRNHIIFGLFGMLMTAFVFTVCWSESGFRADEHRRLTGSLTIDFEESPFGFRLAGREITNLTANGTAEKKGLQMFSKISKIGDAQIDKQDESTIKQMIVAAKNKQLPVTMTFQLPTPTDLRSKEMSFTAIMHKSVKASGFFKKAAAALASLNPTPVKLTFKWENPRSTGTSALLCQIPQSVDWTGKNIHKYGTAQAKHSNGKWYDVNEPVQKTTKPCPRCNPAGDKEVEKESICEKGGACSGTRFIQGYKVFFLDTAAARADNLETKKPSFVSNWRWKDNSPFVKVTSIEKDDKDGRVVIRFDGSAADRVIHLNHKKKQPFYKQGMKLTFDWINKCGFGFTVSDSVNKLVASRRLAASPWALPILPWIMNSIENMEALDWRPRPSRLDFE